jgi:hypothetical protein
MIMIMITPRQLDVILQYHDTLCIPYICLIFSSIYIHILCFYPSGSANYRHCSGIRCPVQIGGREKKLYKKKIAN